MKLLAAVSAAVLSLALTATASTYAQEDKPAEHDQKQEQKAQPARQDEKQTQQHTPAKSEEKAAPQKEQVAKQQKPSPQTRQPGAQQQNAAQQPQHHAVQARRPAAQARNDRGGRIPEARYRASFGQEHRFHVSQADYRGHRFQYGGYSFGFVDPWPTNWLYTQDVYVVEINGVYYLCNPTYPGVNVTLRLSL
jgi:hypothetical protein